MLISLFALCISIPALAISVIEYPIPSGGEPYHIVAGPDGAVWFTIRNRASIGRITTEGVITEFPLPSPFSSAHEIVRGPDGNLWFTEEASRSVYKICRITPGGVITEFPLPNPGSFPLSLINGNNGALWFHSINKLVRFAIGGTVTEFPIANSTRLGGIFVSLAADASGNVHCIQTRQYETLKTEYFHIKLTPEGALTERSLGELPFLSLWHLAQGPDGNVWYSVGTFDIFSNAPIFNGFIPLSESPGMSRVSSGPNAPIRFISGPDGSFWYFSSTGLVNNVIGKVKIDGNAVRYETKGLPSYLGVTVGADGNLWFIEGERNAIVKLTPDSPAGPVVTRATSFVGGSAAPDSIGAIFGSSLAPATESANSVPLPTALAGTSVNITDGSGMERAAPLFFVSASQINFLIPSGISLGNATIKVTGPGGQSNAVGTMIIDDITPGLFTANSSGSGVPAAVVLRVRGDGSQAYEPVARLDENNKLVAVPIDLGPDTDQVYLILFGSGIRGNSDLREVSAIYNIHGIPVVFAGAQSIFDGLDQVNVLLPRNLPTRGEQDVELTVKGRRTNKVRINIK